MEIILARHGQPDLPPWPWIAARRMEEWIAAYDAAGIVAVPVPIDTAAAAQGARLLVSSSSRRAAETARALGLDCRHVQDPLFCEARLPHAMWRVPRLPPAAWAVCFRLGWALGLHGGVESLAEGRRRARLGAGRLIELARESGSAMLVGHGIMNRLIATELLNSGWQGPRRPASGYWQTTRYTWREHAPRD